MTGWWSLLGSEVSRSRSRSRSRSKSEPGVGDEQEAGLPEGRLDLVSEGAGGEATGNGAAADVPVERG